MPEKVSILLKERLRRFRTVTDIQDLCDRVKQRSRISGKELLRVYYYDAPPFDGVSKNPIGGSVSRALENQGRRHAGPPMKEPIPTGR